MLELTSRLFFLLPPLRIVSPSVFWLAATLPDSNCDCYCLCAAFIMTTFLSLNWLRFVAPAD